MPDPAVPPAADSPPEPAAAPPSRARRAGWAAAHLLLGWHVVALTAGPATMAPASPVQRNVAAVFAPYLAALYLGHGYQYFAPDPGPSTLLEYAGTTADGAPLVGRLPDLAAQRPRLLYHRHFMLTERLGGPFAFNLDYHRALADGLFLATGAEELTLAALTHRTPEVREVQLGFGLDDPALYSARPLGTFHRDDETGGGR